MSSSLPHSAHLAWWLTAWLRGNEVTDHVLDAIAEDDVLHLVEGDPDGNTLLDLLLLVRRSGATAVGLALPVEGDLLGLGGPPGLNGAALEAGEAIVAGSVALVPDVGDDTVHWHIHPAAPRQLPDVGEADRALRAATLESANRLADLDVASWRPEVADELTDLRHRPILAAPHGTPPRCVDLAARALRGRSTVDLALRDDGGAVTSAEVAARREALVPLERASRRALVAACSPEVWPP